MSLRFSDEKELADSKDYLCTFCNYRSFKDVDEIEELLNHQNYCSEKESKMRPIEEILSMLAIRLSFPR